MAEKTTLDPRHVQLIVYRSQESLIDLLQALNVTLVGVLPNVSEDRLKLRICIQDDAVGWVVPAIRDPAAVTFDDVDGKVVCGDVPLDMAEHAMIVLTLRNNGDPAGRRSLGAYRVHRAA